MLDVYHRRWKGEPLGPRDFVISADEKTQIPIHRRPHPIIPPAPPARCAWRPTTFAVGARIRSRVGRAPRRTLGSGGTKDFD